MTESGTQDLALWWKRQLSFPSTGNLYKRPTRQLQQSSLPSTRQLLAWTGCSRLLDLCESKYYLLPVHLSLPSAKFVSSLFLLHRHILNIPACSSKSKSLCDKHTNKTTRNSVILGNISSVNYEIPQILWDPTVYYRFHKSRLFFLILNQTKAICALPSCISRSISILAPCICKGLPSSLPPSGFPTKIVYAFLFSFFWSFQRYLVVTPLKMFMFTASNL